MARPHTSDTASVVVQSASSFPSNSANIVAPSAAVVGEQSVGVAQIPAQIGTAISKTVHYAETPVISGYASTLLKPELSALDAPFKYNLNRYFRPVKTIVPKVVPIEPKVNGVQVPLVTSLKELEIHPPILPEVRVANSMFYPSVIVPFIR